MVVCAYQHVGPLLPSTPPNTTRDTSVFLKMSEQSVVSELHGRVISMKNRFYFELSKVSANAAKNCVFLTKDSCQKLVFLQFFYTLPKQLLTFYIMRR
jgi:hypothetical protein